MWRASLATAVVCVAAAQSSPWPAAQPAHAAEEGRAYSAAQTNLSPDEFLAAFDDARLSGLRDIGPAPAITGNAADDARIRSAAQQRGYQRRPEPNRPLVAVGRHRLQPEAAAGWESLRAAAAGAGFDIRIRSAHRGHSAQLAVFRKHFQDTSPAALDLTLTLVAPPGYSKHHTGYALDLSEGSGDFNYFGGTASYRWLAADNFANAKAHGWVPSYPQGSKPTGPNPEPWEFVWVGATNIICADLDFIPEGSFCDTAGSIFSADVDWLRERGITTGCRPNRFCGDGLLTRAQASALLWRYSGRPETQAHAPFPDVPSDSYFAAAVRWMFSTGVTTGTSSSTFAPNRAVSRAEFVTFLWRMASRPEPVAVVGLFADVSPTDYSAEAVAWAAQTGVTTLAAHNPDSSRQTGDLPRFSPGAITTREQAAAFLHRFAAHQSRSGDDRRAGDDHDDDAESESGEDDGNREDPDEPDEPDEPDARLQSAI